MWAYMQHLQLDQPLPNDISILREYLEGDAVQKRRWIAEWNLATMAKEIILNAQDVEPNQFLSSLKNWNYLSGVVNKLQTLEGSISQIYIDKNNVLGELRRLFFLEFPWQIHRPHNALIFRYFSIYSDKSVDAIIQKKYGLSIKDIYTIGLLFWGAYIDKFAIYYPPKIEVAEIDKEKMDKFLKYLSEDVSVIKNIISESNKLDENFLYRFNPLKYYPIIRGVYMGKEAMICPVPTFLFWRLSGGIYYDIMEEKGFDNAYGKAFENYVGGVLKKTNSRGLAIYQDEEYYPRPGVLKKTVDFIIGDDKEILFIECKAKRMRVDSQTMIDINEKINKDYTVLAEGIFQLYKTLNDYLNNLYPNKYNNQLIYPLIITLEDWFLSGHSNIGIDALIGEKVKELFNDNNLSLNLLEKYPYSMMCVEEFESAIQAMQQTSFRSFIETKLLDREKSTWPFSSYIDNYCKENSVLIKGLFSDDYIKQILPFKSM